MLKWNGKLFELLVCFEILSDYDIYTHMYANIYSNSVTFKQDFLK